MNQKYIGYRQEDFAMPYAAFFNETIAPIPFWVQSFLNSTKRNTSEILPIKEVPLLAQASYHEVESGYAQLPDGSLQVAVLTAMPKVSPLMWDWWFGWHGNRNNKYKLWHPKAHQSAVWQDGGDEVAYIGRTSLIEEYIGKKLEKAAIRFVSPLEMGFFPADFSDKEKAVYVCARLGYSQYPLDFGWLVHQIRQTEEGAEMRSRFWMGGPHIAIRSNFFLAKWVSKILQKVVKLPEQQAIDLMTHCSEEMNHLATFLPKLYELRDSF